MLKFVCKYKCGCVSSLDIDMPSKWGDRVWNNPVLCTTCRQKVADKRYKKGK